MHFPANIVPDGRFFLVTFPDIPEAITQGDSIEDALLHAADVLESAMDFYLEDNRPVPAPSKPKRGQYTVELPTSYTAKILLLNEMLAQKVRPAELARRMKATRQEVNRLLDTHHATKIDSIAKALEALGKTLELRVV